MKFPRRSISELQARYELEPTLKDIYVEGFLDKDIIDSALSTESSESRACYAIDDVEIDASLLHKYGLTSGNRQRVIALARELNLPSGTNVRFIVDRDFESWIPSLPSINGLVVTKFSDIESIFFSDKHLRTIFVLLSNCKIDDWDGFFEGLKTCLREVFCVRLEFAHLECGYSLIDFTKCINIASGAPKLNLSDLITRSLSRECGPAKIAVVYNNVNIRLPTLCNLPHQLVTRGHDFVSLIAWCVRARKGIKAFQDEEAISRLFVVLAKEEKDDVLQPIS